MAEGARGKPMITVIAYSRDKFPSRKAESIEEALSISGYNVVWVNVDTVSFMSELKEALGIHETPMKTLRRANGRARVMVFPDYLFLLLHQVHEIDGGLKRERIGILLKGNLVITI